MKKIFFFLFLFFPSISLSKIDQIKIQGNIRVSESLITSFVEKKDFIDVKYLDDLTKKLYATELFSDVKISFLNNVLSIIVSENSSVNLFFIKGVEGSDLDEINKLIIIKEGSIFTPLKFRQDIENIKKYFKQTGYYFTAIEPEVIKIQNNQINLILNIDKKYQSKVKKIYFIGNKHFKSNDLIDVVSTSEYGWWKLFTLNYFSEERLENDSQLLKNFYRSKGFYDVAIESSFAIQENNDFNIFFSINSGKKYTFGTLNLIDESKELTSNNLTSIKDIVIKETSKKDYSYLKVLLIEKKIKDFFDYKRIPNLNVITTEKKADNEKIDLVININKFDNFFINKIIVSGNTITKETTIRDRLKFSEGDLYKSNEVNRSVDNLKAARFFSKIDIETKEDKLNMLKDVEIKVKEQSTGSISAGVGYGTLGGIFEGSINESNFLGEGIDLNFTGRFSTQQISGKFDYSTLNFLNSNRNANISLFSEKDEFKNTGFKNKKIGTINSTNYEIYEDVFLRPNFVIQHDRITAGGSSSALLRSRAGDFLTTSLGYGINLDKRNSKFKTTEGFFTYFDQNFATFLSDIPILQTGGGITLFNELFNPEFIGSAKVRLDSGIGITDKNIKLSDRIFATSKDLRGFQSRGVGPVDSGDHIGGNYLATLSLKSTFPNPLPEMLRPTTFLFFDSGNVWGVDYSDRVNDSNKIRSSLGIGIDIVSPLGPLSFTFSNVISKAPSDKVQNFTFNIGSTF